MMLGSCQPLRSQLADLARLQPGWLDGSGYGYDKAFLDRVGAVVAKLIEEHGLPTPFVFPTGDGDVRVEWRGPRWDVVLRFSPDADVDAIACERGTDRFVEGESLVTLLATVTREVG